MRQKSDSTKGFVTNGGGEEDRDKEKTRESLEKFGRLKGGRYKAATLADGEWATDRSNTHTHSTEQHESIPWLFALCFLGK